MVVNTPKNNTSIRRSNLFIMKIFELGGGTTDMVELRYCDQGGMFYTQFIRHNQCNKNNGWDMNGAYITIHMIFLLMGGHQEINGLSS